MGYPLAALAIRPPAPAPDMMEQYARAINLKNMMQLQPLQLQQAQLQTQALQRQAQYEQGLQDLFRQNAAPSDEDILRVAGPTYGPQYLKSRLDIAKTHADLQDANDKHQAALLDHYGNIANAIKQANYDPGAAQTLLRGEMASSDPEYAKNATALLSQIQQNPDALKPIVDQVLSMSPKQQELQKDITVANIRAGNVPITDKINSLNQGMQGRWNVLHPGQPMPNYYQLAPDATSKDFDRVDKLMEAEEKAAATKTNQDSINQQRQASHDLAEATFELHRETAQQAETTKEQNRVDNSYKFASSQLDKTATPIEQAMQRIDRFNTTLDQHNPQADALIAPELLSFMAGGAGSGVRQNQAELNRIVGGRSAWQNLEASIQHWSLNPDAARTITPDQDRQIRALVGAVEAKVREKQRLIQVARTGLSDPSATVGDHRRIMTDVRGKLDSIDNGTYTVTLKAPDGSTWQAPMDQVQHYVDKGATVQ